MSINGETNIVIATIDQDYSEAWCADCGYDAYAGAENVELAPLYQWENRDTDTPSHCPSCDVLLDWDMTDSGLDYVQENVLTELTGGTEGLAVTDWHPAYGQQVKEALPAEVREHLEALLDTETVLAAYLDAQLWSGQLAWLTNTAEFNGEEMCSDSLLDSVCSVDDLPGEVLKSAREDVENFLEQVGEFLHYFPNITELSAEQMGHDFSLTRNHHGAGFWDRGLQELGQYLTTAAHGYGSSSLYGSIVLKDSTLADPELLADSNLLMETLTVWETN